LSTDRLGSRWKSFSKIKSWIRLKIFVRIRNKGGSWAAFGNRACKFYEILKNLECSRNRIKHKRKIVIKVTELQKKDKLKAKTTNYSDKRGI
jgi:hypothetical protein